MLEAEAALSVTDWLAPEDGVLDILSYAFERTTMPGTSHCKWNAVSPLMLLLNCNPLCANRETRRDQTSAFLKEKACRKMPRMYNHSEGSRTLETDQPI